MGLSEGVYRGLLYRVQGLGFRVQGLGFRVWGLGFRHEALLKSSRLSSTVNPQETSVEPHVAAISYVL